MSDAVATRRTVRAFLPNPVPRDLIATIPDKARTAPSGCNFQPWEASILTGEPRCALQAAMRDAPMQDPPEYDIQPRGITEPYLDRLRGIGAVMYGAEAIARDDAAARRAFMARNIFSFGAPAVLFCHFPRFMGPPQCADVGMWLQTIMLLAREAGLDTCPQECMALHARLINRHIGIDDTTHILFCGIGYRDPAAGGNGIERPHAALNEQARFRMAIVNLTREVAVDTELDGASLRAGDPVVVPTALPNLWARRLKYGQVRRR